MLPEKPLVPISQARLISLPIAPLLRAVNFRLPCSAVADTGKVAAFTAAASFSTASAALWLADTATATATPPMVMLMLAAVCAVPSIFRLPVAATPALWSGKPITVKSKYALFLNAWRTINCAHEPRPNKSPACASLNNCTGVKGSCVPLANIGASNSTDCGFCGKPCTALRVLNSIYCPGTRMLPGMVSKLMCSAMVICLSSRFGFRPNLQARFQAAD